MGADRAVELTSTGISIAGEPRRLVSAEVHSWRLAPEDWPAVLDAVRDLGFGAVSTYVPWSEYETADGAFDFTGPRDIVAFCALARERDLAVVLRVGPDCGAELPGSGWPRRVLDDPACQALRPDGRPYLLVSATHHCFPPSYAATATKREVARWYDAVAVVVAPLQAPAGPVIAVQVDNELGYHFQSNSYALDHHPDALAEYRAFVVERWGGLTALNAAYGTQYASTDDIVAPADASDEPELRRTDWVAWKEQHIRTTLATLSAMLRARGIDRVPLVHNHHPRVEPPIDLGAVEQTGVVDLCGADLYVTRHGGPAITDLVRHLCGSSRLPYMAELGTGWITLPWLLPMGTTPLDAQVSATRALFGGVRAANVFMAVERDRWSGSPISTRGVRRDDRAWMWPKIFGVLDELRWDELVRWAPVLLAANRAEQRCISGRDTLANAVPCFSQVLPLDPRLSQQHSDDTVVYERWHTAAAEALRAAGVDFDRATTSALPHLARYDVVVVPTLDHLDAAAVAALRTAAARGQAVVVGPSLPTRDELDRAVAGFGATVLTHAGELAPYLPRPAFRASSDAVDLAIWNGEGREVVVAWNRTDAATEATICFDGAATFAGHWEPETLAGEGEVTFALPPFGVQVWEVTRP